MYYVVSTDGKQSPSVTDVRLATREIIRYIFRGQNHGTILSSAKSGPGNASHANVRATSQHERTFQCMLRRGSNIYVKVIGRYTYQQNTNTSEGCVFSFPPQIQLLEEVLWIWATFPIFLRYIDKPTQKTNNRLKCHLFLVHFYNGANNVTYNSTII